jgi:hypothetical protein
MEQELQWRREAAHHVVEIKVGTAWVEHSRAMVESEALVLANKALTQEGVAAVRILSHDVSHVCNKIFEEKAAVIMRVPAKMEQTGRKQSCPVCYDPQPVASDGTDEWIFCASCDKVFPA